MSRRSYTPSILSASSAPNLLPLSQNDIIDNGSSSVPTDNIPLNGRDNGSLQARPSRHIGSGTSTRRRNILGGSSKFRMPVIIRRIFKPLTMDFETAMWEILYLVISPKRVYKQLYYHKQTKNTWARDDPSFNLLLSFFLIISALAWGFAYSPGIFSLLRLIIYMVMVDFLATGVVVATVGWIFANKFLKQSKRNVMSIGGDGELEWAYCFDVHCNSFLIIWICLYVVQFILLPVLTANNWIALFLGNTLYAFAFCYYCVITFYGYNAMPFLERTELLLAPVPIILILYVISLFGFNIVKTMLHVYFG